MHMTIGSVPGTFFEELLKKLALSLEVPFKSGFPAVNE